VRLSWIDFVLICVLIKGRDQTMQGTISRVRLAGLGLVALFATGSIAAAETVQLKADLKGSPL